MHNAIPESEFLARTITPVQYIGIYELDWILDDNQLDCEGIIVAFEDAKCLIRSQKVDFDHFDFFYYTFHGSYECRKILSSPDEPISFIGKDNKETPYGLRFQIGERPILAMAIEDGLMTIGISHWDANDNWLDFENNHLLNDQQTA